MAMSRLWESLKTGAGLQDVAESLEAERRELEAHRTRFRESLAGLDEALVAPERQAVERSFDDYGDWLSGLERTLAVGLDHATAAARLEALSREMAAAQLRSRDAAWQARGPTGHPGVNELLALVDRQPDFLDACERELLRVAAQQEVLPDLPPFIAEAWDELLPAHRDWLEETLEAGGFDPEEAQAHLLDWGLQYTACDVDYLSRKYSARPTRLPPVNFALNAQRLCLEGLVAPELVEHAVQSVLELLEEAGVHQGPEAARASYADAATTLREQLEALSGIDDVEELQEHGARVNRIVDLLTAARQELESQRGHARLDYRAE